LVRRGDGEHAFGDAPGLGDGALAVYGAPGHAPAEPIPEGAAQLEEREPRANCGGRIWHGGEQAREVSERVGAKLAEQQRHRAVKHKRPGGCKRESVR